MGFTTAEYWLSILMLIIGVCIGFSLKSLISARKKRAAAREAASVLEEAKKEAEKIKKEAILQAKDELYRARLDFEAETRERRFELQNMERRLVQKEENLERKMSALDAREADLTELEKNLARKEEENLRKERELENLEGKYKEELERVAGMTSEEAKEMLIKSMETEARYEAAKLIKKIEDEALATADKKAKTIIATAIQRYSADYVAEHTVSVVNLPNDEMKGRIIGREGRNIRAIEAATGVDLIIDDTPEAVIVSAYNPIRREIARISLERLITDGRIHPARIEEIVQKVSQELEQAIIEAGEQAAFDVGVHGIHPELIKLLGRLKYRTSYAQNVLSHSIEVAFICGIMAAELGLNAKQAKRAGLLHDIGKAVDHEVEGSHAIIGAEMARKYGESPEVVNAILGHHSPDNSQSLLAILVSAADSLSAARPGARREMLESYIKRLEDLERIANSFKGVSKSYAIQAGREIRVMVESDKISDEEAVLLTKDITKKIESELSYPGQIKVVVIRETRVVDYAK